MVERINDGYNTQVGDIVICDNVEYVVTRRYVCWLGVDAMATGKIAANLSLDDQAVYPTGSNLYQRLAVAN